MNKVIETIENALKQEEVNYVISKVEESRVFVDLDAENQKLRLCFSELDDDVIEISIRKTAVSNVRFSQVACSINEINLNYRYLKCLYTSNGNIDIHGDFVFLKTAILDREIAESLFLMLDIISTLCKELEMSTIAERDLDVQLALRMIKMTWPHILRNLRDDYAVTPDAYNTWLLPLEVVELCHGEVYPTLRVKHVNSIAVKYLTKHYTSPMRNVIYRLLHLSLEIEFFQ